MPDDVVRAPVKRVELSNGQWAEIRLNVSAADLYATQLARVRERREFDLFLDTLASFKTKIVQWSLGPVTQDLVDGLSEEDTFTLAQAIVAGDAKEEVPNESAPSSAGTAPKGKRGTVTSDPPSG